MFTHHADEIEKAIRTVLTGSCRGVVAVVDCLAKIRNHRPAPLHQRSERAVALKNPDAIAVIVTALRLTRGDEAARAMLVGGMSLAALIDTMFSADR